MFPFLIWQLFEAQSLFEELYKSTFSNGNAADVQFLRIFQDALQFTGYTDFNSNGNNSSAMMLTPKLYEVASKKFKLMLYSSVHINESKLIWGKHFVDFLGKYLS